MNISSGISVMPSSSLLVGGPIAKLVKSSWLTEGRASGKIIADSASKVKLFAVDNNAGVPDAINLLADKLPRELRGKSAGEVIDM